MASGSLLYRGMNIKTYNIGLINEHNLLDVSLPSLRNFIKLILGINPTPYWFHQTLTFNPKIYDSKIAKKHLNQLLDLLQKSFPAMAAFFIMGNHKKQGLHFHLIILFFGEQKKSPEAMREEFDGEVFARWNAINGGNLFRRANLMTLRQKEGCLDYLLPRHVRPTNEVLTRKVLWHGIRNKELIRANSVTPSKQEASAERERLFPKLHERKNKPERPQPRFTRKRLREERGFLDYPDEPTGFSPTWENFKRRELNTTEKVSDKNYIRFKNGEILNADPKDLPF